MGPRETFSRLSSGILNIIRAADLYLLHIIADLRKEEVHEDLVKRLMNGEVVSGYNVYGGSYKEAEIGYLQEKGHLKEIGQQIILSTYVAIEFYLIEKFKEYLRIKLDKVNNGIVEKLLKRISFRSLDEIKENYSQYLDIHLQFFDFDIDTDEKSSFQPNSAWDALKTLSKARNELAHTGISSSYKVVTLLDVWFPFDFARRWVARFEGTFDRYVHHGSAKLLSEEYLAKVAATGGAVKQHTL